MSPLPAICVRSPERVARRILGEAGRAVEFADHRGDGISADAGAALGGEDADGGRVGLDGTDRGLQVVVRLQVLDGDHVAVLVVAAMQVHRRLGETLRGQFGVADQPEGALAVAPVGRAAEVDGVVRAVGHGVSPFGL